MSIGYFTNIDEAESYFENERLVTEAWDELESGQKVKAIIQGYNRMYYDSRWELPTYDEASVLDLARLQKANAEMAYYLAVHLSDEDRRVGLQAQGVRQAGIVKEAYSIRDLQTLPVPPVIEELLEPWSTAAAFGAVEISRDEEDEIER